MIYAGNTFSDYFKNINEKKIIIYGAGKFGMALKSYLDYNGFNVIAWVDNAELLGTIKWEQARKLAYDKVIISTLIYETTSSILQSLKKDGVDENKILFAHC